jgi:hypothetical protein
MTPKDTANKIISKYFIMLKHDKLIEDVNIYTPKKCALIAVDLINEALTDYGSGDSFQLQNMDSEFRYWEQVKQEINNLQIEYKLYNYDELTLVLKEYHDSLLYISLIYYELKKILDYLIKQINNK